MRLKLLLLLLLLLLQEPIKLMGSCMMMMMMMMMIISEAPRVGGAPKLRKCSNLPIRENSVIT